MDGLPVRQPPMDHRHGLRRLEYWPRIWSNRIAERDVHSRISILCRPTHRPMWLSSSTWPWCGMEIVDVGFPHPNRDNVLMASSQLSIRHPIIARTTQQCTPIDCHMCCNGVWNARPSIAEIPIEFEMLLKRVYDAQHIRWKYKIAISPWHKSDWHTCLESVARFENALKCFTRPRESENDWHVPIINGLNWLLLSGLA